MILVDAKGVTMSRPGRDLFTDISLTISTGERLALVGLNGTGKTTLVDVLTGAREPEVGSVVQGRGIRVATLDQQPDLGTGTIADCIAEVDCGSWEIEAALDRLGMGTDFDRSVSDLSGGERKRIALAKTLVNPSDLLILDEPTNHLDIDGIEWLEQHLSSYKGGLILVTHDRHVLDRVTNRIFELDRGNGYLHVGGYSAFLEGKAEREDRAVTSEKVRANLAKRELAWLRRGAPARTSKAKSRIRSATELVEARPEAAAREGSLDLHFGTPRLGNDVVELSGVSFAYPGEKELLLDNVTLSLDPRERLGIVGKNGSGKSTLLDILASKIKADSGSTLVGSTVNLELFDQQGSTLNPAKRVWEHVVGDGGSKPDWRDKALMDAFWFDSDAQFAPVELLSGGERRRLQLLVTLARQPNVLLLDEPTNDLDLDTLRSLEDFLESFPGAVVVVSHDRAFLERTVDDVIILDGSGTAERMPGGYEAYEQIRREANAVPRKQQKAAANATSTVVVSSPSPTASSRSHSTIRHDLKTVEADIRKADKRQAELTEQLIAGGDDHAALAKIGAELTEVSSKLAKDEERWLELSEEIENR